MSDLDAQMEMSSTELREAAAAQDAAAEDARSKGFNYLAHAHRDLARMLRNEAERIDAAS